MDDGRNDIRDDRYDTLREHIIFIGDYLSDGEKSSDDDDDPEIYFDQDDKHRWTLLCYRLDKVPLTYLINIIKKYREELLIKLDKETLEELCLYDEPESVFLSYRMDHTKNMRITINGFLPKKDFIFFVEILKQYSFKYDGLKKEWYLPYLSLKSLDTISYLIDLDEMGIESLPIPQVILDNNHIDNVIYNISNHLIADTIALKYFDDGKFSFYSTFSPIFNEILSNKSSILSGITEYNPNDHGRETFDISFVEEILEKLTKALPDFNIIIDSRIKKAREEHDKYIEELKRPIPKVHEKMAPGLSLFPYQNEGVRFLEQTGGNALIGDEMGLGKTIQTLAWVAMHNKKALVIAPKVVRRNWVNEAIKFFPIYFNENNSIELCPRELNEEINLNDKCMAVVNYESFEKFLPFIEKASFNTLIIDESHRIKSDKAKITQAIKRVADSFQHKILLSGTAVKNKKEELFNQLQLVAPQLFDKKELKHGTIGGVWMKMRTIYLARQKINVLKELPEKITSIAEIDGQGLPTNYPQSIEQVSRFKADMAIAKAPLTIDFVNEILLSSDSCVLIFTDCVEATKLIAKGLGDVAILHHGQLSDKSREHIKDYFQSGEGPERVLVSTRQSLAVGATLTRADKVVFNDLPWSAADVRQAEDRTHRIGQRNTVNVYWITGHGNLWDDRISELIKHKYALTKAVNEGKQITLTEREWMERPISLDDILGELRKKQNIKRPKRDLSKTTASV